MRKKIAENQKGQALLIVLLVMVVGLTVGLSLATRSVTDIKISTQLEESSRAFSAAEAGIESALKGEVATGACSGDVTVTPNVTYNACVETAGGTASPLSLGKIGIADTYTVWLVWHKNDGSLDLTPPYTNSPYSGTSIDVCWQKTEGTIEPAMEITLIYKDAGGSYKVQRGAYDPSLATRLPPNNFSATSNIDCGLSSLGFSYGTTFSFPLDLNIPIALRLRPFYADSNVGIRPLVDLPSQGLLIISTGRLGDTRRKVQVIQSYPQLPAIFDYVLFSGNTLCKGYGCP